MFNVRYTVASLALAVSISAAAVPNVKFVGSLSKPRRFHADPCPTCRPGDHPLRPAYGQFGGPPF